MSLASAPPLLDALSALADATRCRMLLLLDRQELTVGELCAVLQLPQSTVSRHLKTLAEAGWVDSRRDGTSRFYGLAVGGADSSRAQIWELTRPQWVGRPAADQDARRLAHVLAQRRAHSQQFFASSAGQWDRMRDALFGADFALRPLLHLLPRTWRVADLGCGTGALLEVVAPHVASAIGVDASAEMLAAAERRLGGLANVDLRAGQLEALPIESGSLDAAMLMLVLHHLPSPQLALSEAARVLRPGGQLLLVDMAAHDREEYRRQMGHVWLGFAEDQVHRLLLSAGFGGIRIDALPPITNATGPALFAASGMRPPGAS